MNANNTAAATQAITVNITGSNDTGVVRCSGMLVPDGEDDGELTLNLVGTGVVLERELRDALPAAMRQIWDDVDPRGNAEFSATVRHRVKSRRTDVEVQATPQGDTVSIEPAWFPCRMEQLKGALEWKEGAAISSQSWAIGRRSRIG
mgnify:CR=1 FL=1